MSLEADLERARGLSVGELADAIETVGFECTRCGACCKAVEGDDGREPHTATVFPDEVRDLQDAGDEPYDWRDVARPMPYGLAEGDDGPEGETFEWALQTDACGDCTFYRERESRSDSEGTCGDEPKDDDGTGVCTVHDDRPLICRTYPFSVVLDGETAAARPTGEAVDREGPVRAHECEGLGRDIAREDAEELAAALKERAVRELEEAIAVREGYEPTDAEGVVVHDSEGQKRPDGTPLDGR
ncbi:zinc/iron-chelating domain-containing protein [Halobacteriales archaeon QS_9_70_65]|nr:MAG: zinc/iron-chelating domain-containing protein [Halobacteriales archaeon QS_9_70_65]